MEKDKNGVSVGNSFISSIKVAYSDDGVNWIWYQNGTILPAIVNFGIDAYIDLVPFDALIIRVYAETYYAHICTRIEVYCSEI